MGNRYARGASPTGRRTMVFLSAGVDMDVGDEVIRSLEAEHGSGGSSGGRGCGRERG